MITPQQQQDADNLILLIPERERICLDAYLFNESNKIEAYKVAKNITDNKTDEPTLNSRANSWINNRASKAYLTKYKTALSRSETLNSENNEKQDKDKQAIIDGVSALIDITTDIKLKSDLYMKLNELKGYKKVETKSEDQQIRYYLPQRCDNCDYKAEYQANNK